MEQPGHRNIAHTPGSRALLQELDFSTDFSFLTPLLITKESL